MSLLSSIGMVQGCGSRVVVPDAATSEAPLLEGAIPAHGRPSGVSGPPEHADGHEHRRQRARGRSATPSPPPILSPAPRRSSSLRQVSGTIDLTSGPLTITNNLEIDGPGAGQLAVSGQGASRVFVIDGGSYGGASQVTIKGLTIEDGLATSDLAFPPSGGGILDLMAGLTLRGCVLASNQAPLGGAGAMIYRGSLNDSGSTWSNNVILGNASSSTVGSDTLGNNGSGVDVFASRRRATIVLSRRIYPSTPASTRSAAASRRRRDRHSASQAAHSTGIRPVPAAASRRRTDRRSASPAARSTGIKPATRRRRRHRGRHNTNLTVVNSSFTDNTAPFAGGAIDVVSWSRGPPHPSSSFNPAPSSGTRPATRAVPSQTAGGGSQISDSLFSANQASGISV